MENINTVLEKWESGINSMSPVLIAIAIAFLVLSVTLAVVAYLNSRTK